MPSPIVISTWPHGLAANAAAWKILAAGGRALDAVEQGARVVEQDPAVNNVGYGGLPDRDGEVTLDACIMDANEHISRIYYAQKYDPSAATFNTVARRSRVSSLLAKTQGSCTVM